MSPALPIRVLIADDHPVVSMGIAGIVNTQPDMSVVGQAQTGKEAVTLAPKHSPDVILMDLRMPEMAGVEAIEAILAERPACAVIVLTTYQGDEDNRSVRAGQRYIPHSMMNHVPAKLSKPALSPCEVEILKPIVKGLDNQGIAAALNIARGTGKWHVNIILRRLDVSDRTQAVIAAGQRGIVEI